ncbi:MAG: hypothetical protein ACYTBP_09100 [Planctomycetota bacterium]|jgi:hypothetical protein
MIQKDTSRDAEKVLCDIYRNMNPVEKVKLIFDACHTGQMLKMAGLRLLYPEASELQLWHKWAEQHLGSELYQKVYGDRDNE